MLDNGVSVSGPGGRCLWFTNLFRRGADRPPMAGAGPPSLRVAIDLREFLAEGIRKRTGAFCSLVRTLSKYPFPGTNAGHVSHRVSFLGRVGVFYLSLLLACGFLGPGADRPSLQQLTRFKNRGSLGHNLHGLVQDVGLE